MRPRDITRENQILKLQVQRLEENVLRLQKELDSLKAKPINTEPVEIQQTEPIQIQQVVESLNVLNEVNPINKPRLAVITTFFNPCNYVNLRSNYLKFSKEIKKHADLFPIELSFDGNFFIKDKNVIQIKGDNSNTLWQKERLLNIALENLPKEYGAVAWLDCDILFENENWAQQIIDKLDRFKVVQVYKNVKRLDEFGSAGLVSNGISYLYKSGRKLNGAMIGTTGFGWAARREVLDKIKFIDTQILGGADAIMYFSFHGIFQSQVHKQLNDKWKNVVNDWAKLAYKEVNGSVDYIDCTITHLYHGKMKNRNYNNRYERLNKINFDPVVDLVKSENGLWKLQNSDHAPLLESYFKSRDEDDNVIKINSYFDNVYLLNLDKDVDKFKIVKDRLDKEGIIFERFSAVDGNHILDNSYDFSKFKKGTGMLENKYALGCLRSHIEIIKDAKRRSFNRILVLEDDISLSNLEVYFQKVKKLNNWKLLYLGASQYNWNVKFVNDFYLCKGTLGTFAFGIDSSIFDEILNLNREILAIDSILSRVQANHENECFTFYPNICIPDVSTSNIRGPRNQEEHSKKMRWNLHSED